MPGPCLHCRGRESAQQHDDCCANTTHKSIDEVPVYETTGRQDACAWMLHNDLEVSVFSSDKNDQLSGGGAEYFQSSSSMCVLIGRLDFALIVE